MKNLIILIVFSSVMLIPGVKAAYTYSSSSIDISTYVPNSVGVAHDGDYLWLLDANDDNITKHYINGTLLGGNYSVYSYPFGLSYYSGYLYYVHMGALDAIYKMDITDGTDSEVFSVIPENQHARGVAYNGSDYWVADITDDIIYRYNSSGDNIENLSNSLCSHSGITPSGINGMHYDSDLDVLWVVDSAGSEVQRVFKMALDGTCSYSFDLTNELTYSGSDYVGITMNGTDILISDAESDKIYIYEYTNSVPTINSNSTNLTTERYDLTLYIFANVSDSDDTVESVNFTLISSNGTSVIDNANGTQIDSYIWNSSTYTIDDYGTWYWWVNATDESGGTANTWGSFDVTLGTLTVTTEDGDQDWSLSNNQDTNTTFNLTFSHDGNSNNTVEFTAYDDLADSTKLLVYYDSEPHTIQYGVTNNVTVTVQINDSVTFGNYSGIIEVNRTDDSSYTNITINVTVEYGVPDIIDTGFTISVAEGGTETSGFSLNDTGNYDLSHCNLTFSTTLGSGSWNITDFSITQSTPKAAQLSVTAGLSSGTDSSASVLLNCTTYTDGSYNTETITGTFTVTSAGGSGDGNPGGGGGGGTKTIYKIINMSVLNLTLSPEYFSMFSTPESIYNRTFEILNPNSDYANVIVSIGCIESDNKTDPSCDWVQIKNPQTGIMTNSVEIRISPGTKFLPGRSKVDFTVEIPENTSYENYRFNILIGKPDIEGKVVLPVSLVRFGGFWGFIIEGIIGFANTAVMVEFENPLPLIGYTLRLWHILAIILPIIVGIIILKRKSIDNYY